ncbi:MAG: stage II sporulation protein D [Bacillota bacterium]|nr:stage II sporulation protein D [Bacillota bacterium]
MRLTVGRVVGFCIGAVLILPALLVLWSRFLWQPPAAGPEVRVWVEGEGLRSFPLEEYLKGVVAAEMPAVFHLEALKAQAVAARTYTVRQMRSLGGPGSAQHPGADLCTHPEHGQAWASAAEMRRRWGWWHYLHYWRKISQAVEATRGEVLTYQGRLIDAVYHAACGGRTEEAKEVWGNDIPYLRSVPCPYETPSPRTREEVAFDRAELYSRLGLQGVQPVGSTSASQPVKLVLLRKTASGRVGSVAIDGQTISGIELRRRLGLRSTLMTWRQEGNRLARAGFTYRQILTHYYQGVSIWRMVPSGEP